MFTDYLTIGDTASPLQWFLPRTASEPCGRLLFNPVINPQTKPLGKNFALKTSAKRKLQELKQLKP
jgi:hypothetical protein